jgi:pimeloyl-ACP methyl ester carboxylesterase
MTEVVVIGGTLCTSKAFPLYRPLLESVPSEANLTARERYIPILYKGLGPVRKAAEHAADSIKGLLLDPDDPPVIVGHSQGGVIAAELATMGMGMASAVISLAGPHGGVPRTAVLEELSPSGGDLDNKSDFIDEHLRNIKHCMTVPFHVVNATYDQIVPRQFGLPNSVQWFDAPAWIPRRLMGVPSEVQPLHSAMPSEHLFLPMSSGVRWLVHEVLGEVRKSPEELLEAS